MHFYSAANRSSPEAFVVEATIVSYTTQLTRAARWRSVHVFIHSRVMWLSEQMHFQGAVGSVSLPDFV